MAISKAANGKEVSVQNVAKIVAIPLSQIDAPKDWNVRRNVFETAAPDEADATWEDFLKSFQRNSPDGAVSIQQDTPVIVRANPRKGAAKPYSLVVGYRRFEAISQISAAQKFPSPTINAEIRELSEQEARTLNLRENTARKSLSAQDLAWGIQAIKAHNTNLTQVQIAGIMGVSQPYVNMLLQINQSVPQEIRDAWRDGVKPTETGEVRVAHASVREMLAIAKAKESGNQQAMFDALNEKKAAKTGGNTDATMRASLLAKAEQFGDFFGKLQHHDALKVPPTLFKEHLVTMLDGWPTKATPEDQKAAIKAAEKAYEQAPAKIAASEDARLAKETEKAEKEAARLLARKAKDERSNAPKAAAAKPATN